MQAYNNIDQHLHLLCQTIAKANRTYVPKKDDDSHTNLFFDFPGNRITGRWIDGSKGKIMLVLNLDKLQFEWINQSQAVVKSVTSIGRTITEIEDELATTLSTFGLEEKGFTDPLHFDIPEYDFAKNPIQKIPEADIRDWAHIRNLANEACYQMLGYLQAEGEVRIWPHHFDTGIYVNPTQGLGVGFGFAMKDDIAGEAYFYLSAYPSEGAIDLEKAPALPHGTWENGEHFKGAVLSVSAWEGTAQKDFNDVFSTFLKSSLGWYLTR